VSDPLGPRRASVAAVRCLTLLAAGLLLGSFGWGALRVLRLERAELDWYDEPASLRLRQQRPNATQRSVRIAEVALDAAQRVTFELCVPDGLWPARWENTLEFAIFYLEAGAGKQLMLHAPLDAAHLAHVRRNARGGCLVLGSGLLEHAGNYAVEAVYPREPVQLSAAVLDQPLQLRVLAKSDLAASDRSCVLWFGLAMLSLLALGVACSAPAAGLALRSEQPLGARLALAPAALALLYASSLLPGPGSTWTLAKGVLLWGVQIACSLGLAARFAPGQAARALGLLRPPRVSVALAAGLFTWPLLVVTARMSLWLVPSTSEAPIQTFIAWPSGMLAAALLGVLLPAAEELFFRGYVYGALLPLGRVAAAALSVGAFALMHAEQLSGNWGGLLAVFAAGAALCGLRMLTGSTWVAAFTHVAYNLTLSLASLFAGA
jgi:membrane protease YdiL (CAAX protease family)